MKTLAVTDFNAHALQVVGEVAETKERVILTKWGKPLAEIIPYSPEKERPGKLSDALAFADDIVSPLGSDMWNACQ